MTIRATAVSEINAIARIMFTDWITTQVGDNPDLLAKVLPDYPATGKRTLQDNGSWLRHPQTRQRGPDPHPDRTHHPERDRHGRRRGHDEADIIVYATGFRATDVLFPMTITGRDGVDLRDGHGGSAPTPTAASRCPASPTSS